MDDVRSQYGEEVTKYVNDNIIKTLLVGYGDEVYQRNEKERRNLTLCSKLLGDPELKSQIVEKIADYGIELSLSYFKPTVEPNLRKELFMRKIYSILSLHQIVDLAIMFDKEIEEQEKQSRK